MKFLLDANLAPGLAAQVRAAGYDCTHMSGLLPPDADDRDVALAANRLDAVLITKDADFLDLKARGVLRGALVWLRCGNMSNRRTAQILLPAVPGIVATIAAGEPVVEIR